MTKIKHHAFLFDAVRCIDCRACMVACSVENNIAMDKTRIWVAGVEVPVAPLGIKLLEVLVRIAPRIVPSNTLIDRVWEKDVSDDVLAVFINRLRAKIELDPHDPIFIKNIRNVGYRFTVRPERVRESQRGRAARARLDILLRRPPCEPTG